MGRPAKRGEAVRRELVSRMLRAAAIKLSAVSRETPEDAEAKEAALKRFFEAGGRITMCGSRRS